MEFGQSQKFWHLMVSSVRIRSAQKMNDSLACYSLNLIVVFKRMCKLDLP